MLIAPAWATAAGQDGGFPSYPLTAGTVAAGDAGTSLHALDGVFLNPARSTAAVGFAATYLTHPETGLRGYALSAGFRMVLPAVLSVWKYEVADLFDEALLRTDPSLASVGIYTTGLDVALAIPIGPVAIGAGTTAEFQRQLTVDHQRFGTRLGVAIERPLGLLGLSWAASPGSTPLSGVGTGTARATGLLRAVRPRVAVQLGAEATWTPSRGDGTLVTGAAVGPPPLRLMAAWRWTDQQLAVGMLVAVERFSLTIGREFGSETVLGGLTALTFGMEW